MLFTFKVPQEGKKIIGVRLKMNFKLTFEGKEESGMSRTKNKGTHRKEISGMVEKQS